MDLVPRIRLIISIVLETAIQVVGKGTKFHLHEDPSVTHQHSALPSHQLSFRDASSRITDLDQLSEPLFAAAPISTSSLSKHNSWD